MIVMGPTKPYKFNSVIPGETFCDQEGMVEELKDGQFVKVPVDEWLDTIEDNPESIVNDFLKDCKLKDHEWSYETLHRDFKEECIKISTMSRRNAFAFIRIIKTLWCYDQALRNILKEKK